MFTVEDAIKAQCEYCRGKFHDVEVEPYLEKRSYVPNFGSLPQPAYLHLRDGGHVLCEASNIYLAKAAEPSQPEGMERSK